MQTHPVQEQRQGHIERIDQVLQTLDELIAQTVAPPVFRTALARACSQLLPGGSLSVVYYFGQAWLADLIVGEAVLDVDDHRAWLNALDERPDTRDYRQSLQSHGRTYCLVARGSPRSASGALVWQRDGQLEASVVGTALELLGSLAELWESYWRITFGQTLETIRCMWMHSLSAWPKLEHSSQLAFALVQELSLATSSQRCVLIERVTPGRAARLVAASGLADVKSQALALSQWLTAVASEPQLRVSLDAVDPETSRCIVPLDGRWQVVCQWNTAGRCQSALPVLSMLWPATVQAWQTHRLNRNERSLRWLSRSVARTPILVVVGILLLATAFWATRHWPLSLHIECSGTLEPVEQWWLFAPADGHVERLLIHQRQQVRPGDPLARIASPALELQLQTLASDTETLHQKRLALEVLLGESRLSTEAGSRDAQRLAGEILDIQVRLEGNEKQRQALEQQREKLNLSSTIAGRVIGGEAVNQLNQKPVRTGEFLFRIVNEQGAWQVELKVPQRDLGHMQRALAQANNQLMIQFSVVGQPAIKHRAKITQLASTVYQDTANNSLAHITAMVQDSNLGDIPVGAQVWATIDTGQQPWWFVVARPVIESWQRRGWL